MTNYERYDDLALIKAPIPVDALAAHVAEGLRAAGYIHLVRDGEREFEGYQPLPADQHAGWLHAMDNPQLFCGTPDTEVGWEVETQTATMRLQSWGESRGSWDRSALTWAVDPTGCKLNSADATQACTDAFTAWQTALTNLVGGAPALTFRQAANWAEADIRISFGGQELDQRFGKAGGVQAVGWYPSSQHPGRLDVDSWETWPGGVPDLAAVLTHEVGHVLGLAHSDDPGSLMYPYASGVGIDPDTRMAARLLYGFPEQSHLPDRGSVASPAMCSDGATAYAAWRGSDGDPTLYLAEFTHTWSAQAKGPGGSSHGPGIAWHAGHLWLAWKGIGEDQRIFVSSYTRAVGWTPQLALERKGTAASPALATFGGQLWLIWRGIDDDSSLYTAHLQGDGTWSEQQSIAGVGSTHGPAALAHSGRLWVLWKGIGEDASLYFTSRDTAPDAIWEAQTRMSWVDSQTNGRVRRYPGSTAEPALFERGASLWAVWRGIEHDPHLYCSRMDATGWGGQIRLPGGSAQGPAAVSTSRSTLFLWRGIDGDPSLYSAGW